MANSVVNPATLAFRTARQVLLDYREDYVRAKREFAWPKLDRFNWAIDWFDDYAKGNQRLALHIVRRDSPTTWTEEKFTYQEMSERSSRIARHFQKLGLQRGDRVLVMLPNIAALWEITLAVMKIGAVIIPTATQATETDLDDRIARGKITYLIADHSSAAVIERTKMADGVIKLLVGDSAKRQGWLRYEEAYSENDAFVTQGETRASDPLLLYFTSGTTAKPKLVLHSHESYPVGHLSTMYWIGLRETDVHQNISSPGWAKHAWSSFFAPWNAGATIFVHDSPRFSAKETIEVLNRFGVTSMCAPPTVWRMMILDDLGPKPAALHAMVGAGEPLNPEVIEHIESAWGLAIRDGFGQTETSLQIGNSPGQPIKLGSMGRPMPGFDAVLLDAAGREVREGEIALKLSVRRPTGLMQGYVDDLARTNEAMAGGYYRTGDEAAVDDEGYFLYVGRGDDVFKSSDYRISPFELESVLIEHDSVVEAAIVPSPHAVRLSVPKAFVVLKAGVAPDASTARSILEYCQTKLPSFKHIRRIEFAELPKTISGKIRRVQLRTLEKERIARGERGEFEFWLEDFVSDAKA